MGIGISPQSSLGFLSLRFCAISPAVIIFVMRSMFQPSQTDRFPSLGDLTQFIGTTRWFYNPMFPGWHYTDGVRYLSDNGCAWLITDILSNLCYQPELEHLSAVR